MNRTLKTLTLVLALAPLTTGAASVYKWTDADGVVHFGDRQPAGTQAEHVSVKSGSSVFVNTDTSAQQKLKDLEQRQQVAAEESRVANAEATRQAQRKTNCDAARQNLEVIRNNSRIRISENGEQRFLTPDEINQQQQKYKKVVQQNCGEEKRPM